MDGKLLYSVNEAAERLGLGRTLTYELVLSGAIKSISVGRCRRVPAQALEEFVQKRLAEVDQNINVRGTSHGNYR